MIHDLRFITLAVRIRAALSGQMLIESAARFPGEPGIIANSRLVIIELRKLSHTDSCGHLLEQISQVDQSDHSQCKYGFCKDRASC